LKIQEDINNNNNKNKSNNNNLLNFNYLNLNNNNIPCATENSLNSQVNETLPNTNNFSKEKDSFNPLDFRGRIEDYRILKEVGKGSYAVVKSAIHISTGNKYAIKIYEKYKLMDPAKKSAVKREIQILKKIKHKNIVGLIEVIDNPKQVK
jgi:MAP/microtubule affinity-regulating kinase